MLDAVDQEDFDRTSGGLRPFGLRRIVARGLECREVRRPIPPAAYNTARRIIIMSGSLHSTEIHRRRHRKEKRNKLRAKLAAAPAGERAPIEAKLQRTYSLVPGTKPSK